MSAMAGLIGEGIRSDCRLTAKEGESEIVIRGQGGVLYRGAIEREVREVLGEIGCSDCQIEIEDSGALPFTIKARVEAAVRLLGFGRPSTGAKPTAATKERLRRTRLYIPGNTPKYFPNAGLYGADVLIFDLEDSVPIDQKQEARILVRRGLQAIDPGRSEVAVRLNPLPMAREDWAELLGAPVQLVLVPKVESGQQIQDVADMLEGTSTLILPIIESARGALAAAEIATASERVVGLAIGMEDYTADLGVQRSTDEREAWWLYGQIVNAAKAAGVQPLASVFSSIDDPDALARYVARIRSFGFEGIGCIHPGQVRTAHRAFLPSEGEVSQARRIVESFTDGVANVDGKMVDRPVYLRALRTVERAEVDA